MIKTLIFDFGDVFINLDKQGAMDNALKLFDMQVFDEDMLQTNIKYEIGAISTSDFLDFYKSKFPKLEKTQIIQAWNYIIKDFPTYRLKFAQELARENKYNLLLLSNTNDLHIDFIKQNVSFYEDFKKCFNQFYLSQEINLRKPNTDIFEFVLKENNLKANECLFIDDTKENIDAAEELGFRVWNIDETKEDVINLFNIKNQLF
ncbi:HAD-IA family hydrolase [Winogradskyella jejuensis]|uniref:Putative hydrolase of the HAD superfamily n=1 Tax=Winogradskyella jejuensis TaxID=1089305 RepID=A0A1M5VQA6_9FLAO|nr:HAD-IA family hydrolase [Winogradskyella jejuensis]SHH77425.1 putative hydrolase of the HAD superfamily [Winogradskyella jejuensis]